MTLSLPTKSTGRFAPTRKTLVLAVAALTVFVAGNASLFRVRQNEVGFVTRFGEVMRPESGPLGPGLHVKVPFTDEADTIAISTDTINMAPMRAFTRDTQEVKLQVSMTYNIPAESTYHLLYEVGRAGNVDIAQNLEAVSNDRVRSIVSRRDVTEIAGEGREAIIEEIKATIASELKRLFLINVEDVQIPLLDFSEQYKKAVNRSTLARAQRLQAEQERERAKVEAETLVVKSKGEADGALARAEGEAQARLAQAKADAESTKVRGAAEAIAIRAKIEAAGGVDGYARQLQAQALLNWKGDVPRVASGAGAQMPLIVPLDLDAVTKPQ